jgi:hypothetical protein
VAGSTLARDVSIGSDSHSAKQIHVGGSRLVNCRPRIDVSPESSVAAACQIPANRRLKFRPHQGSLGDQRVGAEAEQELSPCRHRRGVSAPVVDVEGLTFVSAGIHPMFQRKLSTSSRSCGRISRSSTNSSSASLSETDGTRTAARGVSAKSPSFSPIAPSAALAQ